MCRLAAYLGESAVLLEDVLVKPVNSLVSQSLKARETEVMTNGDGFGVGWYVPEISREPALFTSTTPAWSDRNLSHLTSKIKAEAFFAHVRAASEGGVTQYNCHPFIFREWMFMHNGCISDFIRVKRHLRRLLDDDIYNWIKGDTDSEHLFALCMQIAKGRDLSRVENLADILEEAFQEILLLSRVFNAEGLSYFNICITDGRRLVVSRYCSDTSVKPLTMHYATGSALASPVRGEKNQSIMLKQGAKKCVLVSSEKLSNVSDEWQMLPPHHFLLVDETMNVSMRKIQL
jgi:glutamine amidotransferase